MRSTDWERACRVVCSSAARVSDVVERVWHCATARRSVCAMLEVYTIRRR